MLLNPDLEIQGMKLPSIGYKCLSRILRSLGWKEARMRGSHVIFRKNGEIVVIPSYKEYSKGLLLKILAQAGITREEFLSLYEDLC